MQKTALQHHEIRVNKALNIILPSAFLLFLVLLKLVFEINTTAIVSLASGAIITFLSRYVYKTESGYTVKYIYSIVLTILICFLMVAMGDSNRGIPIAFFVLLIQATLYYNDKLIYFLAIFTVGCNLVAGYMFTESYFIHHQTEYWIFTGLLFGLSSVLAALTANIARGLVESAELRRIEAGQLTDEMTQLRKDIRQLVTDSSQAGDALSESSREVSQAVDMLTIAIQEFALNTGKVSLHTDSISSEANDMDKLTSTALSTVQVSTVSMETIQKSSRMSMEHMEVLHKASKDIGNIVDIISDVADRTNLLALNAALEAARAGEQGKGFAVVSDEIRNLAEQTKSSTENILEIVEGLIMQTQTVMNAFKDNNQQIGEGVSSVEATAKALHTISSKVTGVTHKLGEIALSIQELSSGSEEMAASSEQQVTQVKQMSNASQNLAIKLEHILKLVTKN